VRKSIGDDVIIGGNMDPIAVLAQMPAGAVEAKARENFADGGDSFILMPGCTITPDTPMENVRAMVNVAREMSAPAA
jgi:uroporphyrinogen decarboxylase